MESRAKVLGHGTHPLLVAFPIGLLISSIGFDLLRLITGNKQWSQVAFWNIAAGCLGGWASMLPAAVDWWFLPWGTRAKRIATIHAVTTDSGINLFLASWLMRRRDPEQPPAKALLLSLLGGAMLTLGGWLGGELVQRLGVTVSPGANLDAPNSLTHPDIE